MKGVVDSREAGRFWRVGHVATLGDFMRNVEINRLANDAWLLSSIASKLHDSFKSDQDSRLYLVDRLVRAVDCFESLGLATSAALLRKVHEIFDAVISDDRLPTHRETVEITRYLENLSITLGVEAETKNLYMMSAANAELVKNPLMFGQTVADKFPDATTDIQESGICKAFGRYTASVFHLMRAMEASLQIVANKLDATTASSNGTDLSWGVIVANIRQKIDAMSPGNDKNSWSEVHALLLSVKDAWRNSTMHPKATYTEDEAENIFLAVKGFMNALARMV